MQVKKSWIVLGLVAAAALYSVFMYNRLVSLNEGIPAAWAQVENVLQRRYDLIPNLVATVKGYAKHEKELLTELTKARSGWTAAKSPSERVAAANAIEGTLARLLVVVENYPNLKANEGFLRLQDELAGTENRIAVERMRYNDLIGHYNIAVKRFPSNLIAKQFGFGPNDGYFKMVKEAASAPKVEF